MVEAVPPLLALSILTRVGSHRLVSPDNGSSTMRLAAPITHSLLRGQSVRHTPGSCSLLASLGTPGGQVLARVPLSGLAPTALGERLRTQWPPQGDTPFLFVGSRGQPVQEQMATQQQTV